MCVACHDELVPQPPLEGKPLVSKTTSVFHDDELAPSHEALTSLDEPIKKLNATMKLSKAAVSVADPDWNLPRAD